MTLTDDPLQSFAPRPTGGSRENRRKVIATYAFIGSYFFANVQLFDLNVDLNANNVAVCVILLLTSTELFGGRRSRGAASARLLATLFAAFMISVAFLVSLTSPSWGTLNGYVLRAAVYAVVVISTAAFAELFFNDQLFRRVFWNIGRLALATALAGYVITLATGTKVLTHTAYGYPRMQGFLVEPSAWAPAIAALLLLSFQRRSGATLVLCIAGALAANSPIVIVVALISIPGYFVVVTQKPAGRFILVIMILIAVSLVSWGIADAETSRYLASSNSLDVTLGRLASGYESVRDGGASGTNTRFEAAQAAIRDLRSAGILLRGMGPGAADEYFPSKYGDNGTRANTLWIDWTFNFGALAAGAVTLLLFVSLYARIRRRSATAAIFLPFAAAAYINSATGAALYKFAYLLILSELFGRRTRTHKEHRWIETATDRFAPS